VSNGNCIADDFARLGVRWQPCSKGAGSRVAGWERMRQMLTEAAKPIPEAQCLVVLDSCIHACRTLPTLPRDKGKTDDIDTDAEDHAADMIRYVCSATIPKAGSVSI
jgi:hypothetical protein